MKLLEYEAKEILRQAEVPVPASQIVKNATDEIALPAVLKSQVPVGGRGKAGGVQRVDTPKQAAEAAQAILALPIKGHTPRTLLAEEVLDIQHEYYLALVVNQSQGVVELMAHRQGGVEVEEQSGFWRQAVTGSEAETLGRELADYFELPDHAGVLTGLIEKLAACFTANDATLLEINPLVLTTAGQLVAGDCKMTLDDAARFRWPDWQFEDAPSSANFVTLDHGGDIATIANGAGLAMATVDAVADAGLTPANFLDIGGGANKDSVLAAFRTIMEYPSVRAIVINIFAGITRCDEVAKAIIAAKNEIAELPPLYIRLAGTNYEAALSILQAEHIALHPNLPSCIAAIQEDTP